MLCQEQKPEHDLGKKVNASVGNLSDFIAFDCSISHLRSDKAVM